MISPTSLLLAVDGAGFLLISPVPGRTQVGEIISRLAPSAPRRTEGGEIKKKPAKSAREVQKVAKSTEDSRYRQADGEKAGNQQKPAKLAPGRTLAGEINTGLATSAPGRREFGEINRRLALSPGGWGEGGEIKKKLSKSAPGSTESGEINPFFLLKTSRMTRKSVVCGQM